MCPAIQCDTMRLSMVHVKWWYNTRSDTARGCLALPPHWTTPTCPPCPLYPPRQCLASSAVAPPCPAPSACSQTFPRRGQRGRVQPRPRRGRRHQRRAWHWERGSCKPLTAISTGKQVEKDDCDENGAARRAEEDALEHYAAEGMRGWTYP